MGKTICLVLLLSTNLLAQSGETRGIANETKQNFWRTERIPLISYAVAQSWDWAATEYQEQNCLPWHDQNPLIPSRSTLGRAIYFAGTEAAVILSSRLLWTHHRKLAAGLLWAGTVVELHAGARTTGGCR